MNPSSNSFVSDYGPWALITGASEGIGAAIAADVAARGLNVVLAARREDRLEVLAGTLQKDHAIDVCVVSADLGTQSGIEKTLGAISDKDIGLYAACAGFGTAGPFVDNAATEELDMIDVNCRALTALAHPIAHSMRARRKGGIVLMSSIVAFQGVANSANYAATKAYVQSLAEGLAAELAPFGIDVVASAPGPVQSGFAVRADMQMGGATPPETVADVTLNALGRKITVRPGARSKLLGYSLGALPRGFRGRVLGKIMAGMTKHRDAQN
ncbi:SDR family NAD(P)-dependent oxidoreductase [uncultured Roseobacter sp.]|uniref:SDR family NAD(P)-dependent oxidoreductase n=1 Tax=uncultured Roseobacter sp. TaxID=114847 RepID=UPI0026243E8B|nr:SDR family NAD(P)-dependent oxidoreductase [uncultured Roseobacter sp.]